MISLMVPLLLFDYLVTIALAALPIFYVFSIDSPLIIKVAICMINKNVYEFLWNQYMMTSSEKI